MGVLNRALGDALSVIWHAVRLIGRHWPSLVLIYLVGAAAHNGVLWFCIWLSEDHATAAGFVLPLVPMATLTALILMLRELMPSLPHTASKAAPERRERRGWRDPAHRRLNLLASALVPFLTVYVSQQYLKEDRDAFINAAVADEIIDKGPGFFGGPSANFERIFFAQGTLLFGIVATALVVRWLLDRFDLPQKAVGWGLFAAYVEVLWVFQLAGMFASYTNTVKAWVEDRQFTAWLLERWGDVVTALGPVGQPVDAAAQWFWGILGEADDIVVIPIAWLTVGAVVYGRKLEARRRAAAREPGRIRRAAERVPGPVRRVGVEATANLRGRFAALGNGIRLLAVAGLVPMLLFCLVFLLARQVEYGVEEGLRWMVGPRDFRDALTLSPYLTVLSRGAYTVVLVGLLGAAIDRILSHIEQDSADDEGPALSAQPATAS